MASSPISSKPISNAPRTSAWGLRLFGAIFALAGCGFCIPFFALPAYHILAAQSWHSVPCTILRSAVVTHSASGDDGPTYSIAISFAYDFGAVHYVGTRYNFSTGSSSGYDYRRHIVERLHPGATTVCYVNPQRPAEAVIDRGFGAEMWFAAIPLLFVVVGVGLFLGAGKMARGRTPVIPAALSATHRASPATLKEDQTARIKLITIGLVALFWNGIISFMARDVYSHAHFDFSQIFALPFILVGLGLILGFFYQLLAFFNPRPQMILSNDALSLGQSSEVRWSFAGNYSRINRLTIFVEGREEATYRRGTNTATDTNIFARIRVADTTRQADIGAGRGIFAIPTNTMHSFSAANNKIIWSIVLHGEISGWPDVKSKFNLNVAPRVHAADAGRRVSA